MKPTAKHPSTKPPDTESALWADFRAGASGDAFLALVDYYLPLVTRQLERFATRLRGRMDQRELLGAGVVGLQQAIASCDQAQQAAFHGYAAARIRGAMLDELRRLDPLTRSQRRSYHRICQAIDELRQRLQATPTVEQIATEVGISVANVNTFLGLGAGAISMQERVDENRLLEDTVPDMDAVSPSDAADLRLGKEALRRAFRELPRRDQQLLYLRLTQGMRVSEVAAVLQLSEGRVSQLYQETVERLRGLMRVRHEDLARA